MSGMRAIAVVTGGTRGIGRAISLALARTGRTVYALYARNRRAAASLQAEAAAEGLAVQSLRVNITDAAEVAACIATIMQCPGRLDVLVHSAASGVHRGVADLTPKQLKWTLDVNVFAIQSFVQGLLPYMGRGTRIIGITSIGSQRPMEAYAAIGASKGALESLFRYYARELASKGIVVNVVSPGMVSTEALDAFPNRDERVENTIAATPTGRLTTADEVASVVTFMCSEAASQIIGQTIIVDGGRALV